ncbi:MAG: RNA-binding S4 domain-containing protein [Clostridia bacterium]|nr:RNA-binding S4 domain-containing protein [Clostridia bacterium]MBQ6937151.1 RNA-binding S4 domain-containing protein [Clostridia bacterium]MBR2884588.1 RNA-binding S4 domain-containing protein [Clostridia bacterium]
MIIEINTEFIKLDSALKYCGVAENGAHAKEMILSGDVEVNGEIELRRGKKLYKGDKFKIFDEEYEIG